MGIAIHRGFECSGVRRSDQKKLCDFHGIQIDSLCLRSFIQHADSLIQCVGQLFPKCHIIQIKRLKIIKLFLINGAIETSRGEPATTLHRIQRTPYRHSTLFEHMGIYHGGTYILMPQQLLHRPDIISLF